MTFVSRERQREGGGRTRTGGWIECATDRNGGQDRRAFNEVLQFTDVAWPVPAFQFADDFGEDGLDGFVHPAGEFLDEITYEERYISGTLAREGCKCGRR